MNSGIALLVVAVPSVALAGQVDVLCAGFTDVAVGGPTAFATQEMMPVIENGDFELALASPATNPIGGGPAIPGFVTPLRRTIDREELLPGEFRHAVPMGGALDFSPGGDPEMSERLNLAPTPGSLALLGAGGFGLISRWGR